MTVKENTTNIRNYMILCFAFIALGLNEKSQNIFLGNYINDYYIIVQLIAIIVVVCMLQKTNWFHSLLISLIILSIIPFIANFFPLAGVSIICVICIRLISATIDYCVNYEILTKCKCQHMNWIHGIWGVGAAIGAAFEIIVSGKQRYLYFGFGLLILLCIIFFLHKSTDNSFEKQKQQKISFQESLSQYGFIPMLVSCFLYNGIQNTVLICGGAFLVQYANTNNKFAHIWMILLYVSIFVFRFAMGFLARHFKSNTLIRIGQVVAVLGTILMMIPYNIYLSCAGFLFIGIGCAPIYPNLIWQSKVLFKEKTLRVVLGCEVASAAIGAMVFSIISKQLAIINLLKWLPFLLIIMLLLMIILCEYVNYGRLVQKSSQIVVESLEKQYELIGVMNIDSKIFRFIKNETHSELSEADNYSVFLDRLSDMIIDSKQKRRFLHLFSIEHMQEHNTIKKSFHVSLDFYAINKSEKAWYSFSLQKTNNSDIQYVFMLKNIDELHTYKQMGVTDTATGLYNKNHYLNILNDSASQKFSSCVYIDLNGLHAINNQFGHAFGDQIILSLADGIQEHFPKDMCFRIGGDEYVILSAEDEMHTQNHLLELLHTLSTQSISISSGVASIQDAENINDMISLADQRMLEAKKKYHAAHDRK